MSETLKITLPSALDSNVDLMKLGEIRIKITTRTPNEVVRMNLNVSKNTSISIVGGTQFCDSTGNQLLGSTINLTTGANSVYFKAIGSFYISIADKFAITELGNTMLFTVSSSADTATTAIYAELDVKELTYVPVTKLRATDVFSGQLSDLKNTINYVFASRTASSPSKLNGTLSANSFNYANLTFLGLSNQNVNGSVSGLDFKKLTGLRLVNTDINGELIRSNISSELRDIDISNTNISMNLNTLTDIADTVSTINLSGSLAFGDIASLAKFNRPALGDLKGLNLSGDVSKVNNAVYFISNINTMSLKNTNSNLSTTFWTNKSSSRNYILACESLRLVSGVDQFLIDMASCELHPTSVSGGSWLRTINIRGVRTSASDVAVATLQGKGVTVTITAP